MNWKVAFFSLLIINILIAGMVVVLVLLPKHSNLLRLNEEKADDRQRVSFNIQSDKQDLNQLVAYYLEKETKRPLNYEVKLTDRVELRGEMTVFERDIPLTMTFIPQVQENGDVNLKQDSMSIGRLQVPVSMVLKYVGDNYPLPSWVSILPDEQSIYVSLQELELRSDAKVEFTKFDLEKDDIEFRLLVPVED
ncbi:YpmS family protein [Bacillus tianshenii]|uniref:YpmS family protein n=1 Tax=Sutcliffiella tianshenii TaxID=1463404 RepID=UPI001CD33CAC|nr:YpmS family protein [Bacillus tianshenii]MCA1321116.1 YpmS family protein [Bacillus tianshenii]